MSTMLLGQSIGPFAIEKELGSGAMGTVYLARHEKGAKVAIKIMAPGLTSKVALERFKRESDILKQLKHPNIVRLIASGKYQKNPFYAMEYIEGESLDHVMARRGRITWEEVVTLGQQLCAGLQHAHERGIVHRDLKPSNLMVLADGTVKLTDFGIAKDLDVTQLTAANCTVGTAAYMSPEQCRGDPNITAKSDLYSMGIMFYELLTGQKPFAAESAMLMFELHVNGTFERPSRLVLDIPIWLDTLVCQLMEKDPEKRPFNAETVGQALNRVKEKVEAQISAGIDIVKQRKIDRSGLQPKLDETDKEAARTLLHKKKKKKTIPFYRKGWFQAVGLSAILLAVLYVIYVTFIKAPSADSLFKEAQRLAESDDLEVRREARRGPIPDFLRYYPDDPRATKVRQWDDDIARDEEENSLYRRLNLAAASRGESQARKALQAEEDENLAEAAKIWKELTALKEKGGSERPLGLLAEKYLKDHEAVAPLYKELKDRVAKEKPTKEKGHKDSPEELALEAVRTEKTGPALAQWGKLKELTQQDLRNNRRWYFLAVKRLQDKGPDTKSKDKTK
jgi:serine/threonine-protein kinase